MLNRRHFIVSSTALAATSPAFASGLDPRDKDISFGTTGAIYGVWKNGDMVKSKSMRMMLMDIKHYGLEGFEPYSDQAAPWYDKPQALKKLAQEIGVQIACVGDLPVRPGSAPPAPRLAGSARSIRGWVVKVRRDLSPTWKRARGFPATARYRSLEEQYGPRPPGGPSDDQLKGLAETANEVGHRTKKYGVKAVTARPYVGADGTRA